MDKQQQEKFPAQEAPGKNTDNAFVQVNKDGSPSFPGKDDDDQQGDTTTGKADKDREGGS